MGNVLLQNIKNQNKDSSSIASLAAQARSLGPSGAVFGKLYATNPQFRQFADSMRGKTPEQAFSERGLDFDQVKNLRW